MVMTKGLNRRWEEVEKDSIELSTLVKLKKTTIIHLVWLKCYHSDESQVA